MPWTVTMSKRVAKKVKKLPVSVQAAIEVLIGEIKLNGPNRTNWSHFGGLKKDAYHCHVKSGRPTYVVCWYVNDRKLRLVEVYYAGTHENAPYG